MSGDQHHKSKKARYDLVLVPRDDAGYSKSLRFAPWQIYLTVVTSAVVLIALVLVLLVYTPLGVLIPFENPGLVNKYTKELVSLNQRMTALMEQLVELREYNVKLRNALGEKAVATDTGVVVLGNVRGEQSGSRPQSGGAQRVPEVTSGEYSRPLSGPMFAGALREENRQVTFPAMMPTDGYVTRGFEPSHRHYGLDIAGTVGSMVRAAADGYVVTTGWTSDDGNGVIISHPGGYLTFYKHNQSVLVGVNASVKRGDPIALLGNSGETSAGPHVHFEVWKDGVPIDPASVVVNLNF